MDLTPSDFKKKDPDSFSLDPENQENLENTDLSKRLPLIDVQNLNNAASVLSPILGSPKLRKIDSFSQEEVKPTISAEELSTYPMPIRMTLNLCEAFNKEVKTMKKINGFINTMEENLRLTEQLLKRQEKRIDDFFQEVFELFHKNFLKMAETHKQTMKSRLQQEFVDYKYTHEILKSNLDYILAHDSFSKILQHELYTNPNALSLTPTQASTAEAEHKPNNHNLYTQFINNSVDVKFGLTPLVKKYKLIQYTLQSHHEKPVLSQNVSPNASEIRKEPFRDFVNTYAELESFVARLSSNFSHEISSISNPHTPFIHTVDKIAKTSPKLLSSEPAGKSYTQLDPEESAAVRKRLSQVEIESTKIEELGDKDKEKEKEVDTEPKSPQLSGRSSEIVKTPPTLTPMKNVTYKVPFKENSFTADPICLNNEDMNEISYQSQLISVHHSLSVGDLISVNGAPHRIVHKEWIFPEDILQLVNIFTGERLEVKYNSRYTGMEDQIITKKYQVIKISEKKGYYLLMDMAWDKTDAWKRLPKVFETKDVLDKKLEDDIKEAFYSDKKAIVHALKVKDKEIIVSYRKDWL